jgi:hypothetical protein
LSYPVPGFFTEFGGNRGKIGENVTNL